MKMKIFLLILFVFSLFACEHKASKELTNIEGEWQIIKITQKNVSESTIDSSLYSIFIFTPRYYSMIWVMDSRSQYGFAERWNPTDAEKIERYNSFVVNSGTYEITDSTLTVHPIVARVPEFMGGMLLCEYHVVEDTLLLNMIDEYSYDGIQAPWVANDNGLMLTLVRIDR